MLLLLRRATQGFAHADGRNTAVPRGCATRKCGTAAHRVPLASCCRPVVVIERSVGARRWHAVRTRHATQIPTPLERFSPPRPAASAGAGASAGGYQPPCFATTAQTRAQQHLLFARFFSRVLSALPPD